MQFTSTFNLDEMGYIPPRDLYSALPDGCCVVAAIATDLECIEPTFDQKTGQLIISGLVSGDPKQMKTAMKAEICYEGENYNAFFYVINSKGKFAYKIADDGLPNPI